MKYTYEFADGTTSEVEVSEELYAELTKLTKKEKRNHWKETRRHISLNYLKEIDAQIADKKNCDPLMSFVLQDENEINKKNLEIFTADQRELLELIYIDRKSISTISREQKVSRRTIRTKLSRIMKKIEKNF